MGGVLEPSSILYVCIFVKLPITKTTSMLEKLISKIGYRLLYAVSTFPSSKDWLFSIDLLLIFILIAVPIGFSSNFLRIETTSLSWKTTLRISALALFFPAIAEEIFFRILLLPHPTEQASIIMQWFWAVMGLLIFIIYHPVNAFVFIPSARATFNNITFLILAALLGGICITSYFRSGSLYPPVLIHWLVVVVWLLLLGGYRRLHATN